MNATRHHCSAVIVLVAACAAAAFPDPAAVEDDPDSIAECLGIDADAQCITGDGFALYGAIESVDAETDQFTGGGFVLVGGLAGAEPSDEPASTDQDRRQK